MFSIFFFILFVFNVFCSYKTDYYVDKAVMNYYIKNGFTTERLTANLTTKKDFNDIWVNFLDKEDMSLYDQIDNWPTTKDEVLKYLQKQFRNDSFYFTIRLKDSVKHEAIGQLNFKFYREGVLTLSFWIAKNHRRKGYIKEIGFKFIEELFYKSKRLKSIELYVDDMNIASRAFVKSLFNYLESRHECDIEVIPASDKSDVIFFYYLHKK